MNLFHDDCSHQLIFHVDKNQNSNISYIRQRVFYQPSWLVTKNINETSGVVEAP